MLAFIAANTLWLMTGLAAGVALFTVWRWSSMPMMQRLVALFFIALVAHLWEEGRIPGGFTDLITAKLGFTASNPGFGEMVTAAYVLLLAFVPLFLPRVPFLAISALLLGVIEAVAHTAAIWMFDLERPYSPGMATALVLLLPLSLYGVRYAVRHRLMAPRDWVFSALYLVGGLMLAQQIVIGAGGMSYGEFLGNLKSNITG